MICRNRSPLWYDVYSTVSPYPVSMIQAEHNLLFGRHINTPMRLMSAGSFQRRKPTSWDLSILWRALKPTP